MTTGTDKPKLGSPKSAGELLDMYYLDMRSALLETAAAMDRIQRASGGAETMSDPRIGKLQSACEIIAGKEPGRALRFQELLSVE